VTAPIFVSFKPEEEGFRGFMPIQASVDCDEDPQSVLREAVMVYERHIMKLRSLLREIQQARAGGQLVPARKVWQVGDLVFRLTCRLSKLSLQLDGLYLHLTRDLGVKRKWLEKAIILRRYITKQTLIPKSLNWGRCEKGTRRVAVKLAKGLPLD